MKLRKTCRTCAKLNPTVYGDYYCNSEESFYENIRPANCDYVNGIRDVDTPTKCEYYEPIDIKCLMEE